MVTHELPLGMERGFKLIPSAKTVSQLDFPKAGIRDQQLSPRFQSANNNVGFRVIDSKS
jgi:hypothetical protein